MLLTSLVETILQVRLMLWPALLIHVCLTEYERLAELKLEDHLKHVSICSTLVSVLILLNCSISLHSLSLGEYSQIWLLWLTGEAGLWNNLSCSLTILIPIFLLCFLLTFNHSSRPSSSPSFICGHSKMFYGLYACLAWPHWDSTTISICCRGAAQTYMFLSVIIVHTLLAVHSLD